MDSSVVTSYLYDLSKAFSRFYHDCPILNVKKSDGTPDNDLAASRLELCRAVLAASKRALYLVCIPFLESM
jgi:arginyl-tRNA synthetase